MKEQMMNLQLTTKANDVDAKGRVKVAVNRTGIEDAQGDISMPGSFDKTLKQDLERMKWLYNHDVTQLLGVPLEGSEQNGDVVMVGQLNMDKQLCRDVYTDYKLMAQYGRTLEHSVGVIPIKRNKDDKRMVEEWKMLEYSTLSFLGANPCTYLVDIKSATPSRIKEAVDFLQSALKEPTYSDYRLKSLDMNLQLLLRKLDGGRVVTCPYCGEAFDYDEQIPHTFESSVIDMAQNIVRAIAEDTVYEYISSMKPEIQNEVGSVLEAFKMANLPLSEKSIIDVMNYVWCPHCWMRVFECQIDPSVTKACNEDKPKDKVCESDDRDKPEEIDEDAERKTKMFDTFLKSLSGKI